MLGLGLLEGRRSSLHALLLLFELVRAEESELGLALAALSDVFCSKLDHLLDPPHKFAHSDTVVIYFSDVVLGQALLDEGHLLVLDEIVVLRSAWPVLAHLGEEVLIDVRLGSFPEQPVGASLADVFSLLVLEQIEKALDDLGVF